MGLNTLIDRGRIIIMSNVKQTIKVTKSDLPVSCPQKGTPSWDMHPRVYIELKSEKENDCPYCGVHFVLED